MAQTRDLRETMASVSNRIGPIFSAYLSVNAARPENQERAYVVRLRNALEENGVPEGLRKWILDAVQEENPQARTLAIFAGESDPVEVYRLQVDLPESFRWGEPHVSPLSLVLEEHEPYGVALLDAERFRYFVVSPLSADGEEDEIMGNGYQELDVSPQTPGPRGGMDQDPISRRTEANISEFYNELANLTRDITFREGVRRLILAGPEERIAEFHDRLPEDVRSRVVAREHVSLDAPEGDILERLEAARERAEHERRANLLSQVRETGIHGPEETLKALQEENRVYHLIALWDLEGEMRWCDNEGLAIQDVIQEECPFCGQKTRVRNLKDILVSLSQERGARLEFLRGENENTEVLREEFGGLAGLTRF